MINDETMIIIWKFTSWNLESNREKLGESYEPRNLLWL